MIYHVLGKYEKAVEEAKKAIELDPDFAIGYVNLAVELSFTSTAWRKPRARLQRAAERKLEIPDFLVHAIRHRLFER